MSTPLHIVKSEYWIRVNLAVGYCVKNVLISVLATYQRYFCWTSSHGYDNLSETCPLDIKRQYKRHSKLKQRNLTY